MNQVNEFCDLEAWQVAHQLALSVYKVTKQFPSEEMFGLVSQLRRASVSIGANIAEGFSRYHFKDKVKFYYQARGSNSEVMSHLLIAKDLGYLGVDELNKLLEQLRSEGRLINGLIRSIDKNK